MDRHVLVSVSGGQGALDGIAECSCGWHSAPSWSTTNALRRWNFHLVQRDTEQSWAHALELRAHAAERRVALNRTRDRIGEQRRALAAQRSEAPDRPSPAWLTLAGIGRATQLDHARTFLDLSLRQLWLEYVALGGSADPAELQQMLDGTVALPRLDHDRLGVVLNERFEAAGFGRPLRYWREGR